MSATVARSDRPIGPRKDERGTGRAFLLALLMHALLFALLFYGMRWQTSSPAGSEAELWTPTEVAEPTPQVVTPPPTPAPPAVAVPAPRPEDDADIALQQKKRKQEQEAAEQARLLEAQQQEKARQEALKQKQLAEQQAAAELARKKAADEAARQQKLADQKKADELKHQKDEQLKQQQLADAQKKAAEEKAAKAKAAKEAAAQKAADAARNERLAALRGMANGTPGANGNGLGTQAGGTGAGGGGTSTAGYAERVRAKVMPNIAYAGDTTGNPQAIVAVRIAPDGSILSMTLSKSSGNPAWDAAAMAAIKKSDPLPRGIDGKAPPPSLDIRLRPKG
ncbi:cell envelope integrity protein TolA [Pandoraea pulmonicola]|uniref:Protein TolA n=1 Tax=Pandoraea pulmonicola TaxID=93221 RepID=A0AAJ5CZ90_PANPU|nr:cell envelope integrity protein TolA [Pandoraea pulmonicola]AJC21762.1 protein TolA [Pandoraea pulmonicola]SUA89348.1 cell envelope integrity inner membrane protein TolA [Pandoraea pulmonicola]